MPAGTRDGFAMPPEWAFHEATWLAWPKDPRTWVAGLEQAERCFEAMIEALVDGERVELAAPPGKAGAVRDRLAKRGLETRVVRDEVGPAPSMGLVRVHPVEYEDSWVRDTGPTVLTDPRGDRLGIDWRFDAWGGKYEALEADDALAERLAARSGIEAVRVGLVMEGGAIDVDGRGRLMATEQSLLNPNRGRRSAAFLEHVFELLLGVEDVLWLEGGLRGDDTDGHVDTVARFAGPGRVLAVDPPPQGHPDHEALAGNLARLQGFVDEGRLREVSVLPFAEPVVWEGAPLPASYANFYVGNEAVLVPAFGSPRDDVARSVIQEAFPNRRAALVPARDVIVGYGSCHCLTQQVPAPASAGPA